MASSGNLHCCGNSCRGLALLSLLWTVASSSVGLDTEEWHARQSDHAHDPHACKDEGGAALLQSVVQVGGAPAQVGGGPVEKDPYDCMEGFPNWKYGWSKKKKDWCCSNRGVACEAVGPHAAEPPGDAPGSTDEALEDFLMADRLSDGDVDNDYDCAMDWENWEVVWTDAKKAWCCKQKQLGCPDSRRTGRKAYWGNGTDQQTRRRRRRGGAEVPVARSFKPPEKICVTRDDPRVVSDMTYTAAKAGTRCVFGVDRRDEGWHCIMEGGRFGRNGWCFTSSSGDTWGSCDDACPLAGQAKVLGNDVKNMSNDLDRPANPATPRTPSVAVHAPSFPAQLVGA